MAKENNMKWIRIIGLTVTIIGLTFTIQWTLLTQLILKPLACQAEKLDEIQADISNVQKVEMAHEIEIKNLDTRCSRLENKTNKAGKP